MRWGLATMLVMVVAVTVASVERIKCVSVQNTGWERLVYLYERRLRTQNTKWLFLTFRGH